MVRRSVVLGALTVLAIALVFGSTVTAPRRVHFGKVEHQLEVLGASDPGFSEIEVDAPTNSLIVHLTAASHVGHHYYAKAVPGGVRLRFSTALLTQAQKDDLAQRVGQGLPWLRQHGVNTTGWGAGLNPDGPFEIGYRGTIPDRRLLRRFEIYGPGTVVFAERSAAAPI